jgi:hypothetical protein
MWIWAGAHFIIQVRPMPEDSSPLQKWLEWEANWPPYMKQAYLEVAEFFHRKEQTLAENQTPEPRHYATEQVDADRVDDPKLGS